MMMRFVCVMTDMMCYEIKSDILSDDDNLNTEYLHDECEWLSFMRDKYEFFHGRRTWLLILILYIVYTSD